MICSNPDDTNKILTPQRQWKCTRPEPLANKNADHSFVSHYILAHERHEFVKPNEIPLSRDKESYCVAALAKLDAGELERRTN